MEAKFIDPGTEVEFILGQEMSECHGNFQGKPVVGNVGGIMGNFFIVLSALKHLKLTGDSEKFWKKKELLYFIVTYIA